MSRAVRRQTNTATPRKMGVKHSIKKLTKKKTNNSSVKKKLGLAAAGSVISSSPPYTLGHDVSVLWNGEVYAGKIIKVEKGRVLIHYNGWGKIHDEWIKVSGGTENLTNTKTRKPLAPIQPNLLHSPSGNTDKKEPVKIEDEGNENEEMSDYEKLRQRNIEERASMMQDIIEAKSRISLALSPPDKKTPSKRGLAAVKKEKEVLPPRKSARISGGLVPQIQRYVPELEPEPEHTNLPLRTLHFKETLKSAEDVDQLKTTEDFMLDFRSNSAAAAGGSSSFGADASEYSRRCAQLRILPERVAKVVPDRIFSLAVHPSAHKLLVSAGGKWGGVGLWDVQDTSSQEHGVYLFTPHSRPVNCMSWDRYNPERLITTSYDGTSRILDMNKLEHRLLYGDEEFLDFGGYATAHSQIDANTFLVTKGKLGVVGLVDTRVGFRSTAQDYHVFEKMSAKCIDVHPVEKNIFLAANNRASCSILDTRHQGRKPLMEPVSTLVGHSKSISSALFSPLTGNKVATVSYDDRLRLFDTSSLAGEVRGRETRHNNQTGRWITPFKGHWHPQHDDLYFTGSMGRPREIEAWQAGPMLHRVHSFTGEDLASICSIVAVHPTIDALVGGNSSGRVHVFM